jgi:hypothetical protein
VLVVDRQRLGGFADHRGRTGRHIQNSPPGARRVVIATQPPRCHRVRLQRFGVDQVIGGVQLRRANEAGAGQAQLSAPLVETAETERLPRAASPGRPFVEQERRTGGHAGEREEVVPVVLEDRAQRPRVTAAHVVEVARRNLEPRHVTLADEPAQRLLEGCQPAALVILPP